MPKLPIDYSQTIMYKIVCNDLSITDCYVGHTTNFIKRKNQHKYRCNKETDLGHNFKVYSVIRNNGDWNNWCMIEIEKFNCNDVNEAKARERFWIETLKSNLNLCIPNKPRTEWVLENKDYIKEMNKKHMLNRVNIICECGGSFSTQHKSVHLKTKKHQEYYLAKKKYVDNV